MGRLDLKAHPLDIPRPRHPSRWPALRELAVLLLFVALVGGSGLVAGWQLAQTWHRVPVRVVWGQGVAACGDQTQEVRDAQR